MNYFKTLINILKLRLKLKKINRNKELSQSLNNSWNDTHSKVMRLLKNTNTTSPAQKGEIEILLTKQINEWEKILKIKST